MSTVKELKDIIQSYELVTGISNLKKNELIDLNTKIENYRQDKENYDYHKYKFGNKKITVNNEQYSIITGDIKKNVRIIACAGSGKTTTILCRIKYLIDRNIPAKRIMVTTFNVDAAQNLKQKIVELFGFMPAITLGTIDSIACRFYHRYFFKDYFVGVREYGIELLKYLESSEGYNILDEYDYIFFDEFQDVNQIQFNILMKFYQNGSIITVIGDDAQNIYQFRNSNVKFIIDFDNHVTNLVTYKLLHNYRSTPEIITMANESIIINRNQIKKEMLPINQTIGFIPKITYYQSYEEQHQQIINQIIEFKKNGISDDNIAIVSRNNFPLKLFEEAIEIHNSNSQNQNIQYVSLITEDNCDNKPKIRESHLTITTIHKSKGLEWDIVFILGCSDDILPSGKDNLSLEEERRLFYVAITRAKKYLYLTFSKKKNHAKIPFLTRFVQELPPNCYNFTNKTTKHYNLNPDKKPLFETAVTEILKMFNEQDIVKLRYENIIPSILPITTRVHDSTNIDNNIKDNFWEPDYGQFVDRYITREFGFRNNRTDGLKDACAISIIRACILPEREYVYYKKYINNFKINIKHIKKETDECDYLKIINFNQESSILIENIKDLDALIAVNIIKKIMVIATQLSIDPSQVYVSTESKLPANFRNMMEVSYIKYQDPKLKTDDIVSDIYKISLCSMISNDRRRLLYRKDTEKIFIDNNKEIYGNIMQYIDHIGHDNLKCKKYLSDNKYDINGETDLVDFDNCKIIDFKCSSSENFQFEWLLQLLAYASLIKNENIEIKTLEIYNPLQGLIFTIDISNWKQHDNLIKYMDIVRCRQLNRNNDSISTYENLIKKNQEIIKLYDPYKIMCENEFLVDSLIENYKKSNNTAISKLLKEYYDKYKYDQTKKNLISKIDRIFNKKYMIIDTETSGLPEFKGYNMFYDYRFLNKYKNARLVQLSWGIYDYDDGLISIDDHIIKPNGFKIDNHTIHGITHENANQNGKNINDIFNIFYQSLKNIDIIICHNVLFDMNILKSELYRIARGDIIDEINKKKFICTLNYANEHLKKKKIIKSSKLSDIYQFFFNETIENAHNSKYDVLNTGKIFREMRIRGVVPKF